MDILIIAAVAGVVSSMAVALRAMDMFYAWAEGYQQWYVKELPMLLSAMAIVLVGFLFLRSRDLGHELAGRRKIETALRTSESQFRALAESSPAGIVIYAGKKMLFVNAAAADLVSYSREEILSMNYWDVVHPDDRETIIRNGLARQKGEPVPSRGDVKLLHRQGEARWAKYDFGGFVDFNGEQAVLMSIVDITDSKIAEEQKHRIQTAALKAAANAIVITDVKGVIVWVNDSFSKMTGFTAEEAVGATPHLLYSGKQDETFYDDLWNTIQSGEVWDGDLVNRRKDGSLYDEHQTITPVTDDNGEVTHFIAIKQDVTERKRSDDRIQRQALESVLLATIGRTITSSAEIGQVYESFASLAGQLIPNDRIDIISIDTEKESLRAEYSHGAKQDYQGGAPGVERPLEGSIAQEVIRQPKGVLFSSRNSEELAQKLPTWKRARENGILSAISVPLVASNRPIGMLSLMSLRANAFNESDRGLALRIGDQIAGALANSQLLRKRVLAEQELARLSRQYNLLLTSAGEGIYGVDRDGICTFINPAAARMIKWDASDVVGKPLHDLLHHSNPDGSLYPRHECPIYAAYRDGFADRSDDEVFWRKDGTSFPVEYVSTPMRDEGENLVGAVVTFTDITERKEAEIALRMSEATNRAIINGIPDMIFRLNKDGVYLDFFPGVGIEPYVPPEEFLGKPVFDVLPPATAEIVMNGVHRATESGVVVDIEFYLQKADRTHYYHGRLVAVGDNQVLVVVRDVTDLKMAEVGLRNSNRSLENALEELRKTQNEIVRQERLGALGTMASGIAHDLNNTLTPIKGYSDLLLNNRALLEDDETASEYLEEISLAAQDAESTIRRLREFYRYREDNETTAAVNIRELVSETISLTMPRWGDMAQKDGVQIEVHNNVGSDLPAVKGDKSELRSVLTNLVMNAVDAINKSGSITFSAHVQDDKCVLAVTDTGIGMPDEVIEKAFEPFFTTKGYAGTGLGLSSSFGIVERHGGKINIQSQLGVGTTVRLSLPIHEERAADREPEAGVAPPQGLGILVVDDQPRVLKMVRALLSQDMHHVETADDGEEGLARFLEGEFDVVITDRGMPKMNGDQLSRRIKEQRRNTKVVMMTGFGDMMEAEHEVPEGVDAILSKPITRTQLRAALAQVMPVQPRRITDESSLR